MEIKEYTVEKLVDPTGILTGERYEFHLYVMMDEEDELYDEKGTGLRVLYAVDEPEAAGRLVSYHFFERATGDILDFELEEEEVADVAAFCQTHGKDEDVES